jgi:hypothetical protein
MGIKSITAPIERRKPQICLLKNFIKSMRCIPPEQLLFLYIGAGDEEDGYSVWKTAATGSPPYNFTPIVTNGAG